MNNDSEPKAAWAAGARSAVLDRWTLLSNHVLRAEAQATRRLEVHAGRVVGFEPPSPPTTGVAAWLAPMLLPNVGTVLWTITKAGLLERLPDAGDAGHDATRAVDARITLRVAAPWDAARALAAADAGVFEVHGDERLSADVRWVLDHVRWDVAGDVGRVLPVPLHAPAARVADAVTGGLKRGVQALDAWWPRTGNRPPPR
jgi:hypothetical protein